MPVALLRTVPSYDRLVESLDAFAGVSLIALPIGFNKSVGTFTFSSKQIVAQALRLLNFDRCRRIYMLATILIVLMILLQTGALSLGLMMDRRFITPAAGSKRKSSHSNNPQSGAALKAPIAETGR